MGSRAESCRKSNNDFGCDSGKYCGGVYYFRSGYCATCPSGYYVQVGTMIKQKNMPVPFQHHPTGESLRTIQFHRAAAESKDGADVYAHG